MKTKFWTVIVLAFFVAGAASATELPKMEFVQVKENTAMLAYSFSHEAPLQVSLTNFDGEVLYHKETEHQTEFKKMFDFFYPTLNPLKKPIHHIPPCVKSKTKFINFN